MRVRRYALVVLLLAPLGVSGCLQGRGPAGKAGSLAERSKTSIQAQLAAGKAYLTAEQPNDAFVCFHRATALDGGNYDAQLGVAQASAKLGDTRIGLNAAEAAAKLRPQDATPLLAAGELSLGAQRVDEARKYFQEALRLNPKLAEAWVGLGEVRLDQHALGESIAALQQARDLDPKNADTHAKLASVYAAAGEAAGEGGSASFGRAITEYRAAVKLDPKNPSYPATLAWLLIQENTGLNEALAMAKQADQLDRGDGDALVAGAVALLHQGHTDDAVNQLREGLAGIDTNGDMWIYFAEASVLRGGQGDYDNAMAALERVQALQLPHRRVTQEQVQRLIERLKVGLAKERTRLGGAP